MVIFNSYVSLPEGIGNVILPTDELIFLRGVDQPPTSQEIEKDIATFLLSLCRSGLFHETSPGDVYMC